MQVSVEKVSNVEHRLTITVPAEVVNAAYNRQIEQYSRKAKVNGFRPGKAPRAQIEQLYGVDARQMALGEVIQSSLDEAITAQKLKPIDQPRVEPKSVLENQPLEYIATVETLPEIETVACDLGEIDKLNVTVADDDVDYVLKQLTKQYSKWNLVERAAQNQDRVVIDYTASFEGMNENQKKMENAPLELGSKTMLPGFEEGLVGAKAGDERKLSLIFPENIGDKSLVGKPVEFEITVKQVFEADMPTLDTDFVKKLGIKSGEVADLKQQIRQSLEQERDRLVKEKLKEQVFTKLLEQNTLDIPKSLIARESKSIHDEMHPNHHGHEHSHSDEENAMFADIAKKRIALSLLVMEYAKKNNLKADKGRVEQRMQEIASAYEQPQEVMAWLSSAERRSGIESQVLEDQVLDSLMAGAKVNEKTMAYAELKGIRS